MSKAILVMDMNENPITWQQSQEPYKESCTGATEI